MLRRIRDRDPRDVHSRNRFVEDLAESLSAGHYRFEDFSLRAIFEELVEDGREIVESWDPQLGGAGAIILSEAGVETLPEFQRRGYGVAVTADWARQVQLSGRLALYSTWWGNAASLALVRRLGGRVYAEDFHLT